MGTLTISFLGACTIFRDLPKFVPPGVEVPPNRVVLARVTDAFGSITHVDPHIAKLQFNGSRYTIDGSALPPVDPPVANTFLLDGVKLSIVGATDTELGPSRGLDCLPSLATFYKGDLGMPARSVYVPEIENVQAWFDFAGGEANAYKMTTFPPCSTVPSITVLTVNTDGNPVLRFTPWSDTPPSTIRFTDADAEIDVMNFAFGEGVVDDNRDFLLNYRLVDPFPDIRDVEIPRANACALPSPRTYILPRCGDAGPGCSNTNYP